jgi:hypothetical protein
MGKIIDILKNQLDVEIKSAEEKLTSGNLDAIYKISCALTYLCDMEHDGYKAEETSETTIKKYSNGRYDHNIDALYDAYIAAKKQYKEVGDQGHRDKLMECVGRLMTEVNDMITCMMQDADFMDERKAIERQVQMLANM